MGNAALKQHAVRLLEQHAPLVVKDLPYDELLALSVLGISVKLQRLELQERVLENLAIFLPLEIECAWLEEVELSLRSRLHVHASAQRLVLSVRLRDWEPWLCWNVGCVHASCHACRHVLSTTIFKHDTSAFGELR
ncbi:TTLL10 [Symbiodinium pilosum]|uniref:TTLL10 protein n=1 Tax=Symbiodinium pilosum TaxID=2952 RepID=A0A812SKB2_SYMPI|nr:TTLL10 [Symbiodinium pilosum]